MNKINDLKLPAVILIGSIVLAISILGVQLLKQSSIERQAQKKIAAERLDNIIEQSRIDDCISSAEREYWSYMGLNGTKNTKTGTITAPTYIWDDAKKDKQTAINNCYK